MSSSATPAKTGKASKIENYKQRIQKKQQWKSKRTPISAVSSSSMVRLIVGEQMEVFFVHEKVACCHSE